MKKIFLTQGKYALVDDEDFEWLNQWKWNYDNTTGYARRVQLIACKQITIYLHRYLMNVKKGLYTDHINGDKLNNCKSNLRICSQFINILNRNKLNKNNTSGFKGVSWNKLRNKWHVGIWLKRKNIHIGYFDNIVRAAKAYDLASIKYHGEFGRRNFENLGI